MVPQDCVPHDGFHPHQRLALVPKGLQRLQHPTEVHSLLQFKSEVASCLCMEKKVLKKKGKPSQHIEGELAGKRNRGPTAPVPPAAVRENNTDHWPVVMPKKGWCKYPGCTGVVRVRCTKCSVYLCLTTEKNCFITFHKQ